MDVLINFVKKFISIDVNELVDSILLRKEIQEFILDLNRSQLFAGENAEGEQLKDVAGGYSPFTEEASKNKRFTFKGKSKKKITGESPILFDKGDFYKSLTLDITRTVIEIEGETIKDEKDLLVEYGEEILGLTTENLQILIDRLRNEIIKEYRFRLGI